MSLDSLQHFSYLTGKLLGRETIRTIVEVGARDCRETVRFAYEFPSAKIITFECNPATLPKCRKAVGCLSQVRLIEKAVSDKCGKVKFFPIDPVLTRTTWADGNPGASSLFRASGQYPIETYVQSEIEVESTTLAKVMEDLSIDEVDLLWMDIQGAELLALQSLGDRLQRVRLIHLEVEFIEVYLGQPLYPDVRKYLNENGFRFVCFTHKDEYSGDAVFINGAYPHRRPALLKIYFAENWLPNGIRNRWKRSISEP